MEEHHDLIKPRYSKTKGAIKELIELLHDKDNEIRGKAAKALGEIDDTSAIQPLIASFSPPSNNDVRSYASEAIVKIGKPAVELLIDALHDKSFETRSVAAFTLGRLKANSAFDELVLALSDNHEDVCDSTVLALMMIGDKRAIAPLSSMFTSESENVRTHTINALLHHRS